MPKWQIMEIKRTDLLEIRLSLELKFTFSLPNEVCILNLNVSWRNFPRTCKFGNKAFHMALVPGAPLEVGRGFTIWWVFLWQQDRWADVFWTAKVLLGPELCLGWIYSFTFVREVQLVSDVCTCNWKRQTYSTANKMISKKCKLTHRMFIRWSSLVVLHILLFQEMIIFSHFKKHFAALHPVII